VLLRREPDESELRHHEARIRQGGSRLFLLLRLRYGREGRRAGVRLVGSRDRLARGLGSRLRRYRGLARVLDGVKSTKYLLRLPMEMQRLQQDYYALERQYRRLAARVDQLAVAAASGGTGRPSPGSETAVSPQGGQVEGSSAGLPASKEQNAGDAFYLAFEDAFRGSEASVRERLAPCLTWLVEENIGGEGRPVLDLGSGRGEWLGLLREEGLNARGVDASGAMVGYVRGKGLDVTRGNAVDILAACDSCSLGAVTAFHLVEHLPFNQVVALLEHAFRVLAPGGLVILETPNPENLQVGAHSFWMDPTHRRPLPPGLLAFLAEHHGFSSVRIVPCHPVPDDERPEAQTAFERAVAPRLFGPQDYRLVARKPA